MHKNLSNSITFSTFLNNIPSKPGMLFFMFSILLTAFLYFVLAQNSLEILLLPIAASLILVPFILYYPKFWLYSVILFGGVFIGDVEEGLSATDYIAGVFLVFGIICWLFYATLIKKIKIINNISDYFLLIFFIFSPLTLYFSLENNQNFVDSLKEYVILLVTLYFIPMRYYLRSKRDIITVLILFALATLFAEVKYLLYFASKLKLNVTYAFELLRTVNINQSLFVGVAFASLYYSVYLEKYKYKIVLFLFSILTTVSLIITFSRTFWLVLVLQIVMFFLITNKKNKIQLSILLTILICAFTFILFYFFNDNAKIVFALIENRFSSASKGTTDISAQSRLVEWQSVLNLIYSAPLGGNGFNAMYKFLNPINGLTHFTSHTHNGYFYYAMRVGIPLAFCGIFPMYYYFTKGLLNFINIKDQFYRNINYISLNVLFLLIVTNWISPQIILRDVHYISFISIYLISISTDYRLGGQIEK